MSEMLLVSMLSAMARESCYDEMHVYSPWRPNMMLSFDTVYRICAVCGHPETWMWVDDG